MLSVQKNAQATEMQVANVDTRRVSYARLVRRDLGWRLALAGGIAGMLSNTALHPLDTIKTVRQADPLHFRGVLPTMIKITRERGLAGLYAGIAPALIGSALSSALYFGFYELAKRRLTALLTNGSLPSFKRAPLHAVSAVCGNVASSVLFVPKEVVKQRMQSGVDSGRFFTAALNLIRASGVSGLYAGYKATLLRNIPSTVLRFTLYEEARLIILATRKARERKLTTYEFLIAGALSGAIASACTTPMDVVKTRLSTGKIPKGTAIVTAMRQIVREHGVQGLYFGVRPRIMWAALGTGIGFGSYELCKYLLLGEDAYKPLLAFRQRFKAPRISSSSSSQQKNTRTLQVL